MLQLSDKQITEITRMSHSLGTAYTDEQVELMSDFTTPTICFADPGTGKTQTIIAGLIIAETVHKVNPENIVAVSFTNKATIELETRYKKAYKKFTFGANPRIKFSTIHKLCNRILGDYYSLLGFDEFRLASRQTFGEWVKFIEDTAKSLDIPIYPYTAKKIWKAISELNSSLCFDEQNVISKACFIETKLPFEDFTRIRKEVYEMNRILSSITIDSITLYTLELLLRNPDISKEIKNKYKIIVVDEFQDVSLVTLKLLSLMTDTLVVVGDMKQQIYGFNGACFDIVDQYKAVYKNHREVNLTQSFRCKQNIATFSTGVILPNKDGGENFKGVTEGGQVSIEQKVDIDMAAKMIYQDCLSNGMKLKEDVMFLYRNNYSSIPVVEALWKLGLPIDAGEYRPAYYLPIVSDIVACIDLVKNPSDTSLFGTLTRIIPDLRRYAFNWDDSMFFNMIKNGEATYVEPNYYFKTKAEACKDFFEALRSIKFGLEKGESFGVLFKRVYFAYYELYLKEREQFLEYEPLYYMNIVAPLMYKTFDEFMTDENEKKKHCLESTKYKNGVTCMTMHASKGTEADVVYLMDVDEGILPNSGAIARLKKLGCNKDIAKQIRNERSLLYVACTRAKKELHICYRDKITELIGDVNAFSFYDDLYRLDSVKYDDVTAFTNFATGGSYGQV